ncbi:hypothetical protein LINPERHAP2_LOCUS43660, partial [Linum perenne]
EICSYSRSAPAVRSQSSRDQRSSFPSPSSADSSSMKRSTIILPVAVFRRFIIDEEINDHPSCRRIPPIHHR